MSIIPLAIYILAVSVFSNVNIANGKPVPEYSDLNTTKIGKTFHNDAPQQLFESLNGDWFNKLQGETEVDTDNRHGDDVHTTSTESTTARSIGFDFNYLFNKDTQHKKTSNKQWDEPQLDKQNEDHEQTNLDNSEILYQNQQVFDFNDQGFDQDKIAQFDPFSFPFVPAPNFLNLPRQSYRRNRRLIPMWAPRSYSNGFGIPLPQFFPRGFGSY